MSGRRKGPISKKVKHLCYGLFGGRITERDFQNSVREIIDEYGDTGYILQGIGMAIQKWSLAEGNSNKQKVWRLADGVDIRIRELFENWAEKMME